MEKTRLFLDCTLVVKPLALPSTEPIVWEPILSSTWLFLVVLAHSLLQKKISRLKLLANLVRYIFIAQISLTCALLHLLFRIAERWWKFRCKPWQIALCKWHLLDGWCSSEDAKDDAEPCCRLPNWWSSYWGMQKDVGIVAWSARH